MLCELIFYKAVTEDDIIFSGFLRICSINMG
jgi:hypothetical protein